MSIHFFIPGTPVPQGSKKWVGRMIEANTNLGPWRATITAYALQAMLSHKQGMLTEPLAITVDAYFKRPKYHYGTGKNSGLLKPNAPAWVSTTPDADKIARALLDGITDSGLWKDDSLVVSLKIVKKYAEQPGLNVTIEVMPDEGVLC